jgi:hypothetical protein
MSSLPGAFELGRRMPQEAHLESVGQAAGVWLNPRLVRVQPDPNPARSVTGLVASCPTVGQAPPVAGDK